MKSLRRIFITLLIFVGSLLLMTIIGSFIVHHAGGVAKVPEYLKTHEWYFLLIKIALFGVIVFFYPKIIQLLIWRAQTKSGQKPLADEEDQQARKLLQSRWLLICVLLSFELMVNLPRWVA